MPLYTSAVQLDPSLIVEEIDTLNEKAPYAAVVQRYLPKPQERSASTSPSPYDGQNDEDADLSRTMSQSSKGARGCVPKRTNLCCGQEEKRIWTRRVRR